MVRVRLLLVIVVSLAGMCLVTGHDASAQQPELQILNAFPKLTFDWPLGFGYADDGSDRLYVVEHGGLIKVVGDSASTSEAKIFLDLTDRIANAPRGELYSVAFHPDYAENGFFFVRYKLLNPHRTILSRFTRSEQDSLSADPESEVVLFEIETPGNDANHHGGDMAFGPDGYLYVPLGDGGHHLDPDQNAQNLRLLLGKVLRLDVDHPSGGRNYGIPPDNPFAGNQNGWKEEIYAFGFRNPWRLSVDPATGDVWVGDVGEITWEEVNLVRPGGNYGWPIMEGPECLGGGSNCARDGLIPPQWAYGREEGICIIGGYVYRGEDLPELTGRYLYTDHATGHLWSLDVAEGELSNVKIGQIPFNAASFGVDSAGEILVANLFNGLIFRIEAVDHSSQEPENEPSLSAAYLNAPYPNPAGSHASVRFGVGSASAVRVTLHDMLGRMVKLLEAVTIAANGVRDVVLDTADLTAGVYLIRLETDSSVHVQRLVVVH